MWPFRKKTPPKSIFADVRTGADGTVYVDVRGQTCPGYLLAINNATGPLGEGTCAHILTTYAACGEDVQAWCREKGHRFEGLFETSDGWTIAVTIGVSARERGEAPHKESGREPIH